MGAMYSYESDARGLRSAAAASLINQIITRFPRSPDVKEFYGFRAVPRKAAKPALNCSLNALSLIKQTQRLLSHRQSCCCRELFA